jgi:hypothetical protein
LLKFPEEVDRMVRYLKSIALTLAIAAATGCSSTSPTPAPSQLAQSDGKKLSYQGHTTSGSACGIELLDFVPIGIWGRTERAYHAAVTNAGARALLQPVVSDHRIDLMVATLKCASVEGTAVY